MRSPAEERVCVIKKEAPEWLYKSVAAILTIFSESVNSQYRLTARQIDVITMDLINDCPDWSICDFVLFFKGCVKGLYGELKYGIDQARIYEMKAIYEDARCDARERINSEDKAKYMGDLSEAGNILLKKLADNDKFKEKVSDEKTKKEYLGKDKEGNYVFTDGTVMDKHGNIVKEAHKKQ